MPAVAFSFSNWMSDYLTPEHVSMALRILLILLIGFPLVRILSRLTGKLVRNQLSTQSELLTKRFVYYSGIIIILAMVMNELGFKLSALLGAAGVLGLAIGFASQTSVSNIISGIFLISERPFTIGDTIQVGNTTGVVLSIDLLSIKVRTVDNRFVRIPNENMIKNEIINITKFPTRRLNLNLSVAYKDDLPRVMQVLKDIAASEPMALPEPEPVVIIEQYAVTGINLLFGVWGKQEDLVNLKNSLMLSIKDRFRHENIGMPYTYTDSSASAPGKEGLN